MSLWLRLVVVALIAWFAWLPLGDVISFPDRVSVLGSLQADAPAYDAIARELATTWRSDVLPWRHPPGWITMLAAVYTVAGPSRVAGKLISWIAFLITIALAARLARRIYGPPAAWMVALLCASAPGLRWYIGTLQYEIVTGTLLLIVVTLASCAVGIVTERHDRVRPLVAGLRTGSGICDVGLGVACAALVLTRETFIPAVPMVVLWRFVRSRTAVGAQRAAIAAAVTLVIAATPAVVWSAIQSHRAGKLIPISEKGPLGVELGHNPLANGTYNGPLVGIAQPTGLAFALTYPGREVVLSIRKALYFWGVLRDGWNVPHPPSIWFWRATTGLVPLQWIGAMVRGGWLLIAFVAAFWLFPERLRDWWILPAIVAMSMAVHIATLASYRYGLPTLPIVYIIASGPLTRLGRALGAALRHAGVAAACALVAAIVVAMQFQRWPLELTFDAVDLDGASAANAFDPLTGRPARIADAARGVRPVALLPDEYLPNGAVTLTLRAHRIGEAPASTPVARVTMYLLDGTTACAVDLTAGEVAADALTNVAVPCHVDRDGPVMVLIESLGVVDLAFDELRLGWRR